MDKVVNKLIDESVKGVDTYSHNGSTWLIFTESKQWVIELTESKTLWYNYNFFNGMFSYVSMDVVENEHYITKWVEDNVIGVKETHRCSQISDRLLEDTIQNGVKEIYNYKGFRPRNIGDIIENGVKETQPLPDQSGELIGYGNYYHGKEDRTKPFNEYLNEAIRFGIKDTNIKVD